MNRKTIPAISQLLVFLVLAWTMAGPPGARGAPAQWDGEKNGILFEIEDFERKTPDNEDFLATTSDPTASGRTAVYRFSLKGHYVVYRFRIPEDGLHVGWLRYAAKAEPKIGVALNPGDEPEFASHSVPSTGGFGGEGFWQWGQLFEAELAAGEHTMALTSSAMRPDCVFIGKAGDRPDDRLVAPQPRMLDAATLELVNKPLVPVRPDWLDGASDYRLPDWYGEHRVQLHTRLTSNWLRKDPDLFFHAAESFRQMGAKTFVRHIKSGGEGAWWPSRIGAVLPEAADRNLAKEILDDAHRRGLRCIVYHRHMEDNDVARQHPDWIARDWKGEPVQKRGTKICFNSPYADFFLERTLELVDLGADGFYYDEVHMPKAGCWCGFCREKFRAETGLDHPEKPDPGDPVWHKLIDFNNATIERVFLEWRRAIHERNPEVVMLVGSNTWPALTDRHMTHRLFRIADSMKTEFSLPARQSAMRIFTLDPSMRRPETDAKIALGYSLARDACDGRPAHVWTHGVPDETSLLLAASGVIAHGCIANLDVSEGTIPNLMYKSAFELGDKVSPWFAGAKPLRWAAIHYSELARDRWLADESLRWKKTLYPVYGAHTALLRARLPVGIVTDSQLEENLLEGYSVLFLPAPDDLTGSMKIAVAAFRAAGGLVIEQRESWLWHDPADGAEKVAREFLEAAAEKIPEAVVRVSGGPEKMHAVSYLNREIDRLTVSLCNDFSGVYTGRAPKEEDLAALTAAPLPCRGVKLFVRAPRAPARVYEAVSGRELETAPTVGGGEFEIAVPDFQHLAVIAIERAKL